eukprot:TRINITY_DN3441_c0_g1_i1.p1 TRINITY_DN3441_c0_g1~~TRINITY_DN3441_c0_g1_i1.p1  ORF type:complete len:467 (+),score=87.37 TRINITY_DN3441_c0_g1_i1:203-1402(+)
MANAHDDDSYESGGEEEEELSWDSWIDFDMLEDYPPTDEELRARSREETTSRGRRDYYSGGDVDQNELNELAVVIQENFGEDSPDLANVLLGLLDDYPQHRLDIITRLFKEREETIQILENLIQRSSLGAYQCSKENTCSYPWCPSCSYDAFMKRNIGSKCLLEKVPSSINIDNGVARKKIYISEMAVFNPVLDLDMHATPEQYMQLVDYGSYLQNTVIHELRSYLKEKITKFIASSILSCRAKGGAEIFDKVVRMTNGYAGKKPDPNYKVGDVLDAMGCRITLPNTEVLWETLMLVEKVLKVRADGSILEIENFYAQPKPSSYAYRVVPIIGTFVFGEGKYSFELQLTTDRASIAADLFHNTIYKEYLILSASQRNTIFNLWEEAAAEEQSDALQITC